MMASLGRYWRSESLHMASPIYTPACIAPVIGMPSAIDIAWNIK